MEQKKCTERGIVGGQQGYVTESFDHAGGEQWGGARCQTAYAQ